MELGLIRGNSSGLLKANKKARLMKDAPEAKRTIESELNKRLGFGLRIQYTKKRVT